MNRGASFSIFLAFSMSLGACSTTNDGSFPSLSKRPFETSGPIEDQEAAPVAITTQLPDALTSQSNVLLARSRAAAAIFARSLPAAQSAARGAAGSATGSEGWVQAHMILSRLDASRADGVAALGEMDRLMATQQEQGADAGLLGLLRVIQSEIADSVSDQNTRIGDLHLIIGR